MIFDFSLKKTEPIFDRIRHIEGKRVIKNLILLVLAAFGFYLLDGIVTMMASVVVGAGSALAGQPIKEGSEEGTVVMLFLTSVCIILTAIFIRLVENRPLRTGMIEKRKMIPDYMSGLLIGFAMFSGVVLIAWFGGGLNRIAESPSLSPLTYTLLCFGWLIQGFSEEFMFRGWIMTSAGTYHKPWTAVLLSSVLFAAAHLGNDGISILAFVNLTLYGMAAALLILRKRSIWCAGALHSVWNWAQGNFYGLSVSGMKTSPNTVLHFEQTAGKELLNGGAFGLEGGVAATIVLVVCIMIFLMMPQRESFEPDRV